MRRRRSAPQSVWIGCWGYWVAMSDECPKGHAINKWVDEHRLLRARSYRRAAEIAGELVERMRACGVLVGTAIDDGSITPVRDHTGATLDTYGSLREMKR